MLIMITNKNELKVNKHESTVFDKISAKSSILQII